MSADLQFFAYAHLPAHLQEPSKRVNELAAFIAGLPANRQRDLALEKLVEVKDCAVRALLFKEPA